MCGGLCINLKARAMPDRASERMAVPVVRVQAGRAEDVLRRDRRTDDVVFGRSWTRPGRREQISAEQCRGGFHRRQSSCPDRAARAASPCSWRVCAERRWFRAAQEDVQAVDQAAPRTMLLLGQQECAAFSRYAANFPTRCRQQSHRWNPGHAIGFLRRRLPAPELQISVDVAAPGPVGSMARLAWRSARVGLEFDGQDFHSGDGSLDRDRRRMRRTVGGGLDSPFDHWIRCRISTRSASPASFDSAPR